LTQQPGKVVSRPGNGGESWANAAPDELGKEGCACGDAGAKEPERGGPDRRFRLAFGDDELYSVDRVFDISDSSAAIRRCKQRGQEIPNDSADVTVKTGLGASAAPDSILDFDDSAQTDPRGNSRRSGRSDVQVDLGEELTNVSGAAASGVKIQKIRHWKVIQWHEQPLRIVQVRRSNHDRNDGEAKNVSCVDVQHVGVAQESLSLARGSTSGRDPSVHLNANQTAIPRHADAGRAKARRRG
jgi:hypothetical protein